jgi:fibronectin type 3 domain-containing protein
MTRIITVILAALIFMSVEAQTQKRPAQPKKAGTLVSPDTLRKYAERVAKGDSSVIKALKGEKAQARPRFAHLYLAARADRDSIVLRWAPSTAGGWLTANKYGYIISRVAFLKNGKPDVNSFRQLTSTPVKPWSAEEWQKRGSGRKFTLAASQALYGKNFHREMPAGTPEPGQLRAAYDELMNRYSFALLCADLDPLAADGLGLRFVDREVTPGTKYLYFLSTAVKTSDYAFDTAYTVVSAERFVAPPGPEGLRAEEKDMAVVLRWTQPLKGNQFTAYNIYRSEDGGKEYKLLSEDPYIPLVQKAARSKEEFEPSYTDTTVVNYRKYKYQVRGFTPFGDISKPSEVDAMPRDLTAPPAPIVQKPVQAGKTSVKLTWDTTATTPDLVGFSVLRSALPLTGYHVVWEKIPTGDVEQQRAEIAQAIRLHPLPKTARSYVDTNATPLEPYYSVAALDTAGNFLMSLPVYSELVDTARPSVPTGLAGTVDTNGVVHLHWHLGPEPNIIGYRVYWANDQSHEFTERTPVPVKDTVFVDTVTLNTPTRNVYYRIAAVNDRYNHSYPSPVLILRRPDVVPPQPPVFRRVEVSDSSVFLAWSASTSEDVESQALFRRRAGEQVWRRIASFGPAQESYVDTTVVRRTTYEYELEAVDSSGLHSERSMAVKARPYDTGVRPGVQDLQVSYDDTSKTASLSWKYPGLPNEKYWFVVYRSVDANPLTEYTSVAGTNTSFKDTDIQSGKTYRYSVCVMTELGGKSRLSQPVTMTRP